MKKLFLSVVLLLTVSFAFAANDVEKVSIVDVVTVEMTDYGKIITFDYRVENYSTDDEVDNTLEYPNDGKNVEDEGECTVTCSVTVGIVTYTATAGNWFSSCSGAADRCDNKLLRML